MVGAGLQRDISRSANDRVAVCRSITQRHHLSMRATRLLGVPLADDVTCLRRDNATYMGVRGGNAEGQLRLFQCTLQKC